MGELRNTIFGTLVLKTGLVSKEQIIECLKYQKNLEEKGEKVPRLGELMARKGYLTIEQVKEILKKQKALQNPQKKIKQAEEEIGSTLKPGREFSDYQILTRLGSDANGVTVKAKHIDTKKTVSLRVLTKEAMRDNEYVKLFEEHALKAAKIDHPNIAKILAAGSFDGKLYQVSEFFEGVSFRRLLEAKDHLEPEAAVEMAFAVLNALEHSHSRGIFHRHLSPSCIIVLPDKSIKIRGFGSVPRPIEDLEELTNTAGDTPFYVAPEQADKSGKKYCDARTDIYSLGCILYHSLTGTPPFHGSSIEEVLFKVSEEDIIPIALIKEDLPEELSQIIHKMLSLDPEERYQNAAEVKAELEKINIVPTAEAPVKDKAATGKLKRHTKDSSTATTQRSKKSKNYSPKTVSRARQKAKQKDSSNVVVYITVGLVFAVLIGAIIYFATVKKKNNESSRSTGEIDAPPEFNNKIIKKKAPIRNQSRRFSKGVTKKEKTVANSPKTEEESFVDNDEEEPVTVEPEKTEPVRNEEQEDIDPEVLRRKKAIQDVLND